MYDHVADNDVFVRRAQQADEAVSTDCSMASQWLEWSLAEITGNASLALRRFLAPMWVAILSPALLKERPGKFTYVAIPLCLLGVYLIAEAKTGDLGTQHIRTIGIVVAVFQVFAERRSFQPQFSICLRSFVRRGTAKPVHTMAGPSHGA